MVNYSLRMRARIRSIEIAPGIDLEKDVLAHMDFKPVSSPDLKLMPDGIFKSEWGQLKEIIKR